MKAILIDSKNRSIQHVELPDGFLPTLSETVALEHIYPCPPDEEELNGNYLVVDYEPYIKFEDYVEGCFWFKGFEKYSPYYNKALVVGPPADGQYTDCQITLEQVADRVKFETLHNAKEFHRINREQDLIKYDIR